MTYIYVAMWFAIGLILIFSLTKENKIFYLAGAYFIFMGVWNLLDLLIENADMFSGNTGIAFRIVSGAVLLILLINFLKIYAGRKKNNNSDGKDE